MRRTYKGNVVASHASRYARGITDDGDYLEIRYTTITPRSISQLYALHVQEPNLSQWIKINRNNLLHKLREIAPAIINVYTHRKSKFSVITETPDNPSVSFPINVLLKNNEVFLIKKIDKTKKCDQCGTFFKNTHTCNVRNRDYYFHHINHVSSQWWEPISFFPIGSPAETQRLFITYDVETYTWHGAFGKQLIPFMLVFKISGDPTLVNMAQQLAIEQEWVNWHSDSLTFYALTPKKREVGYKFKKFRTELQKRATNMLWKHLLIQNPKINDLKVANGLATVDDVTFKMLSGIKIQGEPKFIEIYVVGHNISGFDEIVMAAQVVNSKTDVPAAFNITRNFMPRAGKILFNDITFSLPNPRYSARKDYTDWQRGICTVEDFKSQFVKFMVRDTFCLTHTSLRNAAAAYSLEVEKGCCPYKAVNEFYMFGSYRSDDDGFPALEYWKDAEEYSLNKELWKKQGGAYNIVQQTLDYCVTDVIVTAQLVSRLQNAYDTFLSVEANLPEARFNVFQRPTISSNSHAIFKQILYRTQNLQGGTLDQVLMAPSEQMYEYVRQSIR